MGRSRALPAFLLSSAALGSLVTVVGLAPYYGRPNLGQSELATGLLLIVCCGFALTGTRWLRAEAVCPSRFRRHFAVTVSALGLVSILGPVAVFEPWAYSGLAGGLRWIITAVFSVLGVGVGAAGWYWYRAGEPRYPLALLTAGLALGLFYVLHQRLELTLGIPVLAVLVVLIVIIPILGVLYGVRVQTALH